MEGIKGMLTWHNPANTTARKTRLTPAQHKPSPKEMYTYLTGPFRTLGNDGPSPNAFPASVASMVTPALLQYPD